MASGHAANQENTPVMQTVENIMRSHKIKEVIAECQFELASNFDTPAIRIIAYHASRLAMAYEEFARLLEVES